MDTNNGHLQKSGQTEPKRNSIYNANQTNDSSTEPLSSFYGPNVDTSAKFTANMVNSYYGTKLGQTQVGGETMHNNRHSIGTDLIYTPNYYATTNSQPKNHARHRSSEISDADTLKRLASEPNPAHPVTMHSPLASPPKKPAIVAAKSERDHMYQSLPSDKDRLG